MIAIINVINNPSFIKRGLQSLHETEIFTFLSFFSTCGGFIWVFGKTNTIM